MGRRRRCCSLAVSVPGGWRVWGVRRMRGRWWVRVGVPGGVGQGVEALETVPLLAGAMTAAGLDPPVTTALARLIQGHLPLDEWVAVVRTTVPPPARWRRPVPPGFWARLRVRIR